jgi:hypothetical protein
VFNKYTENNGDTTDRRPFEINVEDTTPRNDDVVNDVFARKTKNVEKSLLLPKATLRYINEGSDSDNEEKLEV